MRRGGIGLGLALWLVVVWIALWGDLTVANALGGAAAAAAVLLAAPTGGPRRGLALRPLPALRFLGLFLVKLVEANLVVAWEVLTPRNRINEGIVTVPLAQASDALVTLVANAVTLTPGTLTLDVTRSASGVVLTIHVLHLRAVEGVREDVLYLEYLAAQAFGSAACRAAVSDPRRRGTPAGTGRAR